MKKIFNLLLAIFIVIVTVNAENIEKKIREVLEDGTVVINTANIDNKIFGYCGATPIKLHIKDSVVTKVEYLRNGESPEYFQMIRDCKLSSAWVGKKLKDVATLEVDAISGATYSSEAVIENVRLAAKYELKADKQ